MEEDKELELIRMKKLLELRKRLMAKREPSPRELVVSRLVDRGLEVLEAAERKYPKKSKVVVKVLADLIKEGRIDRISGGELLSLLRNLGMDVRLETRISVVEDGRLIPLSEKFRFKEG